MTQVLCHGRDIRDPGYENLALEPVDPLRQGQWSQSFILRNGLTFVTDERGAESCGFWRSFRPPNLPAHGAVVLRIDSQSPSQTTIGSLPVNRLTQASNATSLACETCIVSERIALVKMDLMATSEAYDHEETAPAVVEIPESQQPGQNDNKFQKAIAVWRGT
jgi:hypothetical protein